jgi:hypothetical protein
MDMNSDNNEPSKIGGRYFISAFAINQEKWQTSKQVEILKPTINDFEALNKIKDYCKVLDVVVQGYIVADDMGGIYACCLKGSI